MITVGLHHNLEVTEIVANGAFMGNEGEDLVLLPDREVPEGTRVGDVLRVFVYTDTDDIPVATMSEPLVTLGQFAALEVVDTFGHGAFVDWGLEKDLMVPFKEQTDRLEIGDRRVFYVRLHERTNRLIATARLGRHFDYEPDHFKPNHQVTVLVYGFNANGAHVVVDQRYRGMLYHNEVHRQLHIGDELTAWVKEVREDGRLDVSLQRLGRGAALDAKDVILEAIDAAGGFLPLHDKSDPKAIRRALQMSKKVFKSAIGGLYRDRVIVIESDGVRRS